MWKKSFCYLSLSLASISIFTLADINCDIFISFEPIFFLSHVLITFIDEGQNAVVPVTQFS